MKRFLLLILSLTAGCEAHVKGCEGGWVELTCKYPKDQKYEKIEVIKSGETIIHTTKKDVWEEKGRFYLYHDTRNQNLRMTIKQLEHEDSGKYNCKFDQEDGSDELELKVVKDGCQTAFYQTAYERAKTTITCDFPKEYNSYVKFICKENNEICEEILSTQSSVKSNGTFTLTDTNRFNVSISNVNLQHTGVYWCGVKSKEGRNKTSLRKIRLKIKSVVRLIIMNICMHLLFVIIVTFIYKRFSSSRNTRNAAASQHVTEDNVFEDVQENLLTNPSSSMHYSTATFQNSTDKANSEVLIHKPSSSACEYSTLKNSQSPIYSTVDKPSKTSEDPVLLTINKTQQQ